MATNDFKPFAAGAGANVMTQADWVALAALVTGFQSGKASSAQVNKALRQGTVMASVLGQFVANNSGANVLDNGDTATILTNLTAALKSLLLTRAHPFADIKLDGAAAIAEALSNLGLKTAAQRDVGTGANQIPDMSSFTNGAGWQKLPGGLVIQRGTFGFPVGQNVASVTLPIPFVSGGQVVLSWSDTPASNIPAGIQFGAIKGDSALTSGFQAYMSGAGGFNLNYIATGFVS